MRNLKGGQYTLVVPVPESILEKIGRVAIQWGAFELRMDKTIEAILLRLYRIEPGWENLPFRKRKKLFKDVMTDYTTKLFPHETKTFQAIADNSADLHWRRNTVVHDYVVGHAPTGGKDGDEATFTAFGTHNGKKVQIPLELESLEELAHDVAHLGGNLVAATARMGGRLETESPEIVIADKDFLQIQQSGSFQILPISRPLQSQPPASPPLQQCPRTPQGKPFRRS